MLSWASAAGSLTNVEKSANLSWLLAVRVQKRRSMRGCFRCASWSSWGFLRDSWPGHSLLVFRISPTLYSTFWLYILIAVTLEWGPSSVVSSSLPILPLRSSQWEDGTSSGSLSEKSAAQRLLSPNSAEIRWSNSRRLENLDVYYFSNHCSEPESVNTLAEYTGDPHKTVTLPCKFWLIANSMLQVLIYTINTIVRTECEHEKEYKSDYSVQEKQIVCRAKFKMKSKFST